MNKIKYIKSTQNRHNQMEITIFKDIKDTSQPFYKDVSIIIKLILSQLVNEFIDR